MRKSAIIAALMALLLPWAAALRADCLVVEDIDQIFKIQTRMARNADTGPFATDIRILRTLMGRLSNRRALQGTDGNRFARHGADIVAMLNQSRDLLATVNAVVDASDFS